MVVPIAVWIVGTALIGALALFGGERFIATKEGTAIIKAKKYDIVTTDAPLGFSKTSIDFDALQGSADPKVGTLIETPNFQIQKGEITPSPTSSFPKSGGGEGTGDAFTSTLSGLFSINTIKIILFLLLIIIVFKGVKK